MLMHTPFPTGLSGVRDLRAKKRSSSNSSRDWLRLRRASFGASARAGTVRARTAVGLAALGC
jgi:hypothetical protein